jgi:hypothetical protein
MRAEVAKCINLINEKSGLEYERSPLNFEDGN